MPPYPLHKEMCVTVLVISTLSVSDEVSRLRRLSDPPMLGVYRHRGQQSCLRLHAARNLGWQARLGQFVVCLDNSADERCCRVIGRQLVDGHDLRSGVDGHGCGCGSAG